jgi:hypothetical protein
LRPVFTKPRTIELMVIAWTNDFLITIDVFFF